MYDSDNYNLDTLGHRRWILYPELKYTGFGDVYGSQAMYVSPYYYSQTSEINNVAWPARQMPEALFSDDSAWSLSTGKIESLDKIEVELEDIYGGKVWKFSSSTDPEADDSGYFNVSNINSGLTGCIIFRPNNINIAEESKYQVTIKGTVSGTITYTVSFFSLNKKFPTELKMDTSSISLYPGKQYELTAYGEPQNTDRTIEWSSSDPSVATVSPSGVVTAVSEGQATITASTLNGLTATCVVTVLPILQGTTGDCVWKLIDKELTISGKGAMADYTDGEYNKETPWGTDVRTLIIEDGVEHIGGGAFRNNHGLHDVVLPDSVTSIGENAFRYTKLTNIELSRSVAHIGIGAFASCVNIESLSVDEANPVYDSRDNCNAIIETATNTLIAGCKNTVIPDSVTRIDDQAFRFCRDLTEINIPDSVTSIGSYAFASCSNLSQIWIPDSVTSIGSNAFAGCSNLSQIRIPDSVTSIGRYAFYNTAYYNAHPDGVVYIDKAACGLKGPDPESVIIKDGTLVLEDSLFSQRAVKSVTLPDSLRYLGKHAFNRSSYLSDLTLSNSITSIESQTFFFCRSLKKLTIPDSVKRIEDRAFQLSTGIESISIPNSVTYIGDKAFDQCDMLNSISIPSSVEYIGTEAFSNCDMLTSISVDKDNKHYDSRNNCNAIIETATNTLIAGGMNTVIPDTVVAIGDSAMSVIYLYETVIPESVTTIGNNAFRNTRISEIIIPDSVTSIGDMAFYNCENLMSITIPASVTHIGDMAFGYTYTGESVLLDGFTISGYKGTAAEEYAKANGIEFISLDKPICGDTDNDGTVRILDATFIQRYLIKLAIPFEMNIEVADTDGDGEITITDATFIQRYLNSIEIPYEIGKPIKT